MKVMQVSPCPFLPFISGSGMVTYSFAKMLRENNDCVVSRLAPFHMNLVDEKTEYEFDGIQCYRVRWNEDVNRYKQLIKDRGIDIIFFHAFYVFKDLILETNCRKILVLHHYDLDQVREAEKYFEKIIVVQESHYDKYVQLYPRLKEKLLLCPWPIDDDAFYDQYLTRPDNSVLYAGRVVEDKGVHTIFPYLKQYNLHLTIVGAWDEIYREKVLSAINSFGIESYVTIKDPIVDRKELGNEMNRHRFFYLASTHQEGCPLVVGEALACGMEVIALHQEHAYDKYEGMVSLHTNVDDMISAILTQRERPVTSYSQQMIDKYGIKSVSEALLIGL